MAKSNKPTQRQVEALKSFKIPETEIQSMDFNTAYERLKKLIEDAKARRAKKDGAHSTMMTLGSAGKGSSHTSNAPKPAAEEINTPIPLTETQIDHALAEAINKVCDFLHITPESLSPENQLVAVAFKSILDKQSQAFWIAMEKWQNYNKQQNIQKVKGE